MDSERTRRLAATVLDERLGRIPCETKANQLDLLDCLAASHVSLETDASRILFTYIYSGFSDDWYPFVWLWAAAIPALAAGTPIPEPDPLRWDEEAF